MTTDMDMAAVERSMDVMSRVTAAVGAMLAAEMRVAIAAERARCAAVCREVADAHAADYGGEYGAALECAAAIMRGAVTR